MKKLVSLLVLLFLAFSMTAQERGQKKEREYRKHRVERFKDFTPEQMATLRTKRMALALDLNESQQGAILTLNTQMEEKRKHHMEERKAFRESEEKPSVEARYEKMNEMLDERLRLQQEMKQILSAEQYETWKQQDKGKRFYKHKLGWRRK
ncbi:DUF4890 domain-containing protein [Leptobacterium sp. I13]|uniref:DUF4890 domain-containing protein n=1 Tax=Leptobacterium meishanense TaxID=3128904 RepID=UPI0030EF4777